MFIPDASSYVCRVLGVSGTPAFIMLIASCFISEEGSKPASLMMSSICLSRPSSAAARPVMSAFSATPAFPALLTYPRSSDTYLALSPDKPLPLEYSAMNTFSMVGSMPSDARKSLVFSVTSFNCDAISTASLTEAILSFVAGRS